MTQENVPNQATHLLILFDSPGPSDPEREVKEVTVFLENNFERFSSAPRMKIRTITQPIPDVGDYIQLDSHMFVWLKMDEGITDVANNFDIWRVGINSHSGQYRWFQAAAAIPKGQKETPKRSWRQFLKKFRK